MRCLLFFPFSEWRTKKSPKGSGHAAALWAAIPPAAAGTAQDAGEAAQRQAFLKWTQGEALTAQEKQLVDDLWNTDPAKASEYWAAGEFLDTEVPGASSLDGGGLDGTMGESRGFQSSPLSASRFDAPEYTCEIKWGVQTIKVRPDGHGFWGGEE